MKRNKVLDSDCIFEKKKWISITGLCNNNCMFCLDKDRPDKFHKDCDQIKNEIKQAKEQGNTKLVLSGGDPTIHPSVIDFIKYAKELGYVKIQIVTNGRMFASKTFTDKAISAGLDEVTFSIHGYNPEMHDSLTRVPRSFKQTLKGVKNVFNNSKHIIVNTDTCITKSNYKHLPEIIRFIVEKVGIKEVNLMSMVPQGNAWKYKDEILYDYGTVAPYVHKVIDYCIKNNVVLWLSRFPAEYLEGYEEFIEDPFKMVDDIRGMGENIYGGKDIPECKNIKCKYCGIKTICDGIIKIKQKSIKRQFTKNKNNSIIITKTNLKNLPEFPNHDENTIFELVKPNLRLGDYKKVVPEIKETIPYLELATKKLGSIRVSGIPPCVFIENSDPSLIFNRKISFVEKEPELKKEYTKEGKLDYIRIAEDLVKDVKIKKTGCKKCIFTDTCKGVYQNYVRIYGFKEINPIKQEEIRINLECNQSCYFCNTDPSAENMITQEKEIFNQIRKWSYEGVKFLVISGKEPTLDRNLADYISFAKKNGFKKIELQTNCVSLADKNLVLELKNSGLTHAFVSLHSPNSKISDEITKAKGSFEKTLMGLDNLLENNINTTINIVINKLNYKSLSSIVELIGKRFKGIDSVVFSFVSPVSHAWKNRWIIPKISEVQPYLFQALDLCRKKNINTTIPSRCGIPLCFLKGYENHSDELRESSRWKNYQDKTFLESCSECMHRGRCNGIWERYIQIYGKSEFIKSKRIEHIEINLGKVCNNKCLFCMVYENKNILNKFVPSKQIKKELKHFRNKGYKSVGFLGGEPTIHPNILEIISYAKYLGFEEIHMVSNGRKYENKKFLKQLIEAGVTRFSVSIHHYKKRIEDELTNVRGGFSQKIKGIKNLIEMKEAGLIRNRISLNCVINKYNCGELGKLIKFYADLGIKEFRLNFIRPEGRADDNFTQLVPRYSEFAKEIPSLTKLAKLLDVSITFGDIPFCVIPEYNNAEFRTGEKSDKPNTVISFDKLKSKTFQKEIFSWEERRNSLKAKMPECKQCKYDHLCEGSWEGYTKRFGFKEFSPIK